MDVATDLVRLEVATVRVGGKGAPPTCSDFQTVGHTCTTCTSPVALERRAVESGARQQEQTTAKRKAKGKSASTRQRTKCGFCKVEGHNVRECSAEGIEAHRDKAAVKRAALKAQKHKAVHDRYRISSEERELPTVVPTPGKVKDDLAEKCKSVQGACKVLLRKPMDALLKVINQNLRHGDRAEDGGAEEARDLVGEPSSPERSYEGLSLCTTDGGWPK
jgi:hypothetical protein